VELYQRRPGEFVQWLLVIKNKSAGMFQRIAALKNLQFEMFTTSHPKSNHGEF
jgi:hypothetical protein